MWHCSHLSRYHPNVMNVSTADDNHINYTSVSNNMLTSTQCCISTKQLISLFKLAMQTQRITRQTTPILKSDYHCQRFRRNTCVPEQLIVCITLFIVTIYWTKCVFIKRTSHTSQLSSFKQIKTWHRQVSLVVSSSVRPDKQYNEMSYLCASNLLLDTS